MSLRKTPRQSEKWLAAQRRNAQLASGPRTPKGRERSRAAHLRHGYYSQLGSAPSLLGEDPGEREVLRQQLASDWSQALRSEVSEQLAQALWQARRRGLMREGQTLRLAKQADRVREDHLHARLLRLKIASRTLETMAEAVSHRHYVTTRKHLEQMENLHKEDTTKEMNEVALALLQLLRDPVGEARGDEREEEEQRRAVLRNVRAIFGLSEEPYVPPGQGSAPPFDEAAQGSPSRLVAGAEARGPDSGHGATADSTSESLGSGENAEESTTREEAAEDAEEELDAQYPAYTPAEWDARQPVRQLLQNLLRRKMREYEAERRELLKESVNGPSDLERAAQMAGAAPESLGRRKAEEFEFRQLATLANLLVKIERQRRLATREEQRLAQQNGAGNKKSRG